MRRRSSPGAKRRWWHNEAPRRHKRATAARHRHVPMVGMVVTISPSFSLYRMVVLPAAAPPRQVSATHRRQPHGERKGEKIPQANHQNSPRTIFKHKHPYHRQTSAHYPSRPAAPLLSRQGACTQQPSEPRELATRHLPHTEPHKKQRPQGNGTTSSRHSPPIPQKQSKHDTTPRPPQAQRVPSSPTIRIRISFLPKRLANTLDRDIPMMGDGVGGARARARTRSRKGGGRRGKRGDAGRTVAGTDDGGSAGVHGE